MNMQHARATSERARQGNKTHIQYAHTRTRVMEVNCVCWWTSIYTTITTTICVLVNFPSPTRPLYLQDHANSTPEYYTAHKFDVDTLCTFDQNTCSQLLMRLTILASNYKLIDHRRQRWQVNIDQFDAKTWFVKTEFWSACRLRYWYLVSARKGGLWI